MSEFLAKEVYIDTLRASVWLIFARTEAITNPIRDTKRISELGHQNGLFYSSNLRHLYSKGRHTLGDMSREKKWGHVAATVFLV